MNESYREIAELLKIIETSEFIIDKINSLEIDELELAIDEMDGFRLALINLKNQESIDRFLSYLYREIKFADEMLLLQMKRIVEESDRENRNDKIDYGEVSKALGIDLIDIKRCMR